MNGVQATMLAATAAPVEAGVVLANQSSKSVRDSSPTRSSFEKHLKKACQVPRDNSPSSSEVQEKSDPVKAETGQTEENQVEQLKDQSSEVKCDENNKTETTGDNTSGTDDQGSTSTGTVMAQVMAIPFIGLVKVDSNPLQQEIQAGAGGAVVNDRSNSEIRLSSNTNLEMPQLVGRTIEAVNTAQTDSPATQLSREPQAAILVVNDEAIQASAAEMENAGKTAPADTRAQTVDRLGVGREASQLENQVQVMDDKTIKKTEADAGSATGKKLAEFESHRVSVVRPAQDSNQAEGQQPSSSDGEDTTYSPVLQQVEVEIPKMQVRNVPTSVQNSPVVDPKDLMDQVVKKAEVMIKDNSSEMTLQLKPGFLGKMTIKIAVDEAGTVTAHFSTSSQQVKNVLEQNIQALRHNLEAQGMKVDRTEVNVQLDSGGMMSDPGGRQDLWQQPRGIPVFGFSDSEDEIAPIASQPVSSVQSGAYDTVETNDGYNFLV